MPSQICEVAFPLIGIPKHSRRLNCFIPILSRRDFPADISLSLSPLGCKDMSSCDLFNSGSVPVSEIIVLEVGEIFFTMNDVIDLLAGIGKLDLLGFI